MSRIPPQTDAMIDFSAARLNMVESQIRPNKVTDLALLSALLSVPRERFVPEHLSAVAYVDEDVPLGEGRFLVEPMVFGRLLQLAAIEADETVLEVGCGTGYGSVVLARLARHVVALEESTKLATHARVLLKELAGDNVTLAEGRLGAGWAQRAPYDAILFGGAVAAIPPAITEQLAEGGRLLAVVKPGAGMGKAVMVTRRGGVLGQRVAFDAGTPILREFAAEPSFVF
jgi:protein-L-isoaspartate(D-aspartate) O-methyltransferase